MLDSFTQLGLLGLFLASFLAATVIPASSELVLLFLVYKGVPVWQCIAIATIGNTLGGITTYFIGSLGNENTIKKWTGVSDEKIKKYFNTVNKYGYYCALLSWVPLVGDIMLVVLGLCKTKKTITFLFLFIGKFLRYIVWSFTSYYIFNQ